MELIVTEPYITYANRFSLQSIVITISGMSSNMFVNNSGSERFHKTLYYTVKDKNRITKISANIIQWDLIDMMYQIIINHKSKSVRAIKNHEALHLYNLFFAWCQKEDAKETSRYPNDVLLRAFAFFGEQKRFQNLDLFRDKFARESYILEEISTIKSSKLNGNRNIKLELENIFDIKIDRLKIALYSLVLMFSRCPCMSMSAPLDKSLYKFINETEREKLLDYFSLTIDEVRQSNVGRQIFYSKPLIKINDLYISVNPYLMFFMFENFEYWAIRDKYKEIGTCGFIEDFGIYFENYIGEVITNCVDKTEYRRIEENRNEKRADWILELEGFTFLVEQKSTIFSIKIKQQIADIKELKNNMQKCWVKAMKQLEATQKALKLKNPIKIILAYDDYFKAECLDEVFELPDMNVEDDRNYWLVNTAEFEILLFLYKTDRNLFQKIVKEKVNDESSRSKNGRELELYFERNGITKNEYLRKYGVLDKYLEIANVFSKVGDESV